MGIPLMGDWNNEVRKPKHNSVNKDMQRELFVLFFSSSSINAHTIFIGT